MQVQAWTVSPLSLSGMWRLKNFIPYRTEQMDPRETHGETVRSFQMPTNSDHIPPNTTHSDPSAMLYVFGDNEAVFKMIIRGRSPTMRHVRNFTRDEWNNFLHLFNISHFSSTRCTKNFSLISCSTMAKWIQEQKEEERVVSKSRHAAMNLFSSIATSFSTALSPIASKSAGMQIASEKRDSRLSIEPNSFDAASTSQVRVKDAYLGGLMEGRRLKIYGKHFGDPMEDLNVNLAIWRMFMNTTLQAVVHLGKDCDTNGLFDSDQNLPLHQNNA